MTYNELQIRAAELGMGKTVGKTTEELKKYIADHSPKAKKPSLEAAESPKESQFNLVRVMDGTREVRSYDVETHGKNYLALAEEFAASRKYSLEMGHIKGKTVCPSCGHAWN